MAESGNLFESLFAYNTRGIQKEKRFHKVFGNVSHNLREGQSYHNDMQQFCAAQELWSGCIPLCHINSGLCGDWAGRTNLSTFQLELDKIYRG